MNLEHQPAPRMKRTLSELLSPSAESKQPRRQLHDNRKTKIVGTLGPASDSVEVITEMIEAGMNCARINVFYGSDEDQKAKVEAVREAERKTDALCAVWIDLNGSHFRVGKVENDKISIPQGTEVEIICDSTQASTHVGTSSSFVISSDAITKSVRPGTSVIIGYGDAVFLVNRVGDKSLFAIASQDSVVESNRDAHFPGGTFDVPSMTDCDRRKIEMAAKLRVHFVGLRMYSANDVKEVRKELDKHGDDGKAIQIISKIETHHGLENIDEIIAESDAVLVSRGYLGTHIPIQKVCTAQKQIIRKCNVFGIPVITASQMLESMVHNPRPTRAEANDVANAVFDGTDCVMLSEESAIGHYPVPTIRTMSQICRTAEQAVDYSSVFNQLVSFSRKNKMNKAEAITSSAVKCTMDLNVPLIVVLTATGSTGRFVAKYKPAVPVICYTTNDTTAYHLLISRALWPRTVETKEVEATISIALEACKQEEYVLPDDQVVIVSGTRNPDAPARGGGTDMMKVVEI